MKRLVAIAAIATLVLVPGSALSQGTTPTTVEAKRGASVGFKVVSLNGKPVRVKKFTFTDVLLTCTGGGLFFSSDSKGFGPMPVKNKEFGRKFGFTASGEASGTVKIAGEFKRQNTVVKGTLRARGDFPANGRTDCDSGKVSWKAT